jgi:hypothetical protein
MPQSSRLEADIDRVIDAVADVPRQDRRPVGT